MAEIDGEDHHDATGDVLLLMIDLVDRGAGSLG